MYITNARYAPNYCFNCGQFTPLADGVHCPRCLDFWRSIQRMPRNGETLPVR